MMRSFIAADVYRIMLGCEQREPLLDAIRRHDINHDGTLRVMHRGEDRQMTVCVLFVEGDTLQKLALCDALHILQVDNISARLRAVPALPTMRDAGQGVVEVRQVFGRAA